MTYWQSTLLWSFLALRHGSCLDNGLALTPPMGWMSWQRYRCTTDCDTYPFECISEWLFRNVSDLLVAGGYADLGYKYVIIDDCWLDVARDKHGRLQPDPKRFPSGLKALADYIHSKGLKFGLYQDYGTKTCAGYPGLIDHMEVDTRTFAEWEVDYVKIDGCNADFRTMDDGYPRLGRYFNKTGRPMVYSCSWPVYQEFEGMKPNFTKISETCNLWRNYGDIQDSWQTVTDIMDYFSKNQDRIAQYAGPGHWNDPDMLIIGNYGLSVYEAEAQMAVWSILAAPLLMSTDLANMDPSFKAILQNRQAIAINQDPLGIQGRRLHTKEWLGVVVWTRPISPVYQGNFSHAVAFVNRRLDGSPFAYNITMEELGLSHPHGYNVYNVFIKSVKVEVLKPDSLVKVRVNPSGVVFLKFEVRACA